MYDYENIIGYGLNRISCSVYNIFNFKGIKLLVLEN